MKKIVIFISILLIGIFAVGCAPAQVAELKFDDALPWFAYRTFASETSKYKVAKLAHIDEETTEDVAKDSYLTYTLEAIKNENGERLYSLTADFSITYSDSEYIDESYRGKTDTIKSVAKFRSDNMSAVSTTKEVKLQTSPRNSYSFSVDYTEGSANYTDADGETKTLSFEKGLYYDNEYLLYLVRAFQNTGNSLDETFELVNWYECFKSGKFKSTSMVARYYNSEGVKLSSDIIKNISDSKDDAENKATSYAIMISLSGTKTGAPIYGYYSAGAYNTSEGNVLRSSKKLLTKMITYEYTSKGEITYTTEYNLESFEPVFTNPENAES